MMYVKQALISDDQQAVADLICVREFLDAHGTGLAHAAYILGGVAASGGVVRLVDSVREAHRLTVSHVRRLERLYALLMLENVGDPDREETALFVELAPGSLMVDEICKLADALDDLFSGIGVTILDVRIETDLQDAV